MSIWTGRISITRTSPDAASVVNESPAVTAALGGSAGLVVKFVRGETPADWVHAIDEAASERRWEDPAWQRVVADILAERSSTKFAERIVAGWEDQ